MFYILHGDEEFTRSEEVARLKGQVLADGMGELNITVLDGRRVSLGELINACNVLPFLTNRRLVMVENLLQRLEQQGRSKKGETEESEFALKLVAYLPNLPPTTRLLFLEDKSLGRNNPILKLAEGGKEGYAREFKRLADKDLAGWIRQRAKLKEVSIANEAAGLLASSVGNDLRLLDHELDKLAALANYSRPISPEDVKALTSAAREADIFALVDTLGLRQRERAMRQLQDLLADGANELYLLTMFARQIRLILSAKDLAETQKLRPEEIGRQLQIGHSFVVEKLVRQGQQFSLEELEAIQRRLLDMDQAIKTGQIEGTLALELLVLEICRRRQPTEQGHRA